MEQQAAVIQTDLDGLNAQEKQLEASQQELASAIVAANKMVDEAKAQEEALNATLAETQAQYKAEEAKMGRSGWRRAAPTRITLLTTANFTGPFPDITAFLPTTA